MQDGCKVYMDFYMAANWSCFMVNWSLFPKPPLGDTLNTKPGDHGTPNPESWQSFVYYTIFLGIFPLLWVTVLNIVCVFSRALPSLHCSGFELRKGWASSAGPTVMACKVQVPNDQHLDLGLNFWCSSQIVCTYLRGICFKVLFLVVEPCKLLH